MTDSAKRRKLATLLFGTSGLILFLAHIAPTPSHARLPGTRKSTGAGIIVAA